MLKRIVISPFFKCLVIFTWLTGSAFRIGYQEGNEYSVKAMFLLNFMKYVEWPSENSGATFRIGIVGDNDMELALNQMLLHRAGDGKKIEINNLDGVANSNCQMIFISHSENRQMDECLKKYSAKGVLVVTEDMKTNSGGAINLVTIDNKVRFEINHTAIKAANLKVATRLTELAIPTRQ